MDPALQAVGHCANFSNAAFAALVKCLVQNGALREGQFEAQIRATIEYPGAEVHRLDYKFLDGLLEYLEGRTPKAH